jgi:hypothetical protein
MKPTLQAAQGMGECLRHRAFVLRMEPVPVSTLRASIAFRKGELP